MRQNDSSALKNVVEHQWVHLWLFPLCYFANCLHWSVVLFWGVIRKCILAWIGFTSHDKWIATKLADNMGRDQTAGKLFCKAHTALVWLPDFYIIIISGIG